MKTDQQHSGEVVLGSTEWWAEQISRVVGVPYDDELKDLLSCPNLIGLAFRDKTHRRKISIAHMAQFSAARTSAISDISKPPISKAVAGEWAELQIQHEMKQPYIQRKLAEGWKIEYKVKEDGAVTISAWGPNCPRWD